MKKPVEDVSKKLDYGLFTLTQCLEDEREHDEPEKEHIKLLKARNDPAKALQASEQALDFVAPCVEWLVVRPGGESVLAGRHHGREPEGHREVAGLLALVGAVHHQRWGRGLRTQAMEQGASCRRVVGLAKGKGEP